MKEYRESKQPSVLKKLLEQFKTNPKSINEEMRVQI
jgi:hypothetical protein